MADFPVFTDWPSRTTKVNADRLNQLGQAARDYADEKVAGRTDGGEFHVEDEQFGADGTGVAAASAAIQAAIDAAAAAGRGKVVANPSSTYKLNTPLIQKAGVEWDFGGALLDASTVAADADGRHRAIYAKGTLGSAVLLTRDCRRGDMQVDVTSTAGLSVGDQVRLRNAAARGTLASDITDTATSIVVNTTSGSGTWPTRGFAICGTERIAYDGASVAGNQVTLTVRAGALGRGAQGTTKVAHTAGTAIFPFHSGIYFLGAYQCFERGELQTIDRIVGSTLIFGDVIKDDYPVAQNAQIRKRSPVGGFALRNLRIKMSTIVDDASKEDAVWLDEVDDFEIENVRADYGSMTAVALRNATRGNVEGVRSTGKATHDPSGVLDFYGGVTLIDGCQDITINGIDAKQAFKALTFYSSGPLSSQINEYSGVPSFITAQGIVFNNGGLGYRSRHAAIEIHRAGRHITIDGFEVHGADSLVSIQSGDNVRVLNGGGTGGFRAGVWVNQVHEARGLKIENINVGQRAFGAGYTTVTSDPGAGGTSISVADASVLLDDTTTTSAARLVEITDSDGFSNREVVRIDAADATTLLNCTRGLMNTAAVAHGVGSIVRAYGSAFYTPLDVDLTDCIFKQRAYNQPLIALTADPGTGGTTLATGDTSGQRWPAMPFQALIEGEDSAKNFCPEIVTVTAMTSTSMTVVRGQEWTDGVAHSAGIFVMPYEPAVNQVDIGAVQGQQELVYNGAILRGYVPTRQLRIKDIQVAYNGPVRHNFDSGLVVFAHGARIRDASVSNFPYAAQARGNGQVWRNLETELPTQDLIGGYGLTVYGLDVTVIVPRISRNYLAIDLQGSNLRTTIIGPVMDVPLSSRGVNAWDATTRLVGKPSFVLPAAQDLVINAAATLTPNCPGDLYWRVTGNTGITAIAAMADGTEITLEFTGTPTITPGASLKVNGGAVINTISADDVFKFVCRGGVWRQSAAQSVN